MFATLVIFVGSIAFISAVVSLSLPKYLINIVPLIGAIVSAWYLRPRLSQVQLEEEKTAMNNVMNTKKQIFFTRERLLLFGVVLVVGFVFFIGILMLVGNSEVCQIAVQTVQTNPIAIEQLGTPIKKGLFVSGSIETTGPSGHADVSIPISGPKAQGTLFAVGKKSAGEWKFSILRLVIGSNRYDLLNSSDAVPKLH
jgi:hypothetical protein